MLEDAHTVRLLATGETVRAKHILIATGARAPPRREDRRARTRHFVERGLPSAEAAQAHPDPGRRLYRGGVRRNFQWARLRGDAGLSRRQYPARLRRRPARASARRDGAPRHQDRDQANRRSGGEGRARTVRQSPRPRILHGRSGDVRARPLPERYRVRPRGRLACGLRRTAASPSTNSRRPRCRIFPPSATSPIASISRPSRSARATPTPIRCSAASPRRSITAMCRPRCFPSPRSAWWA